METKNLTIIEKTISRVQKLQEIGGLMQPQGYNPIAAVKAAELILLDLTDKEKRPVLEVCTPASIAKSLLKMVIQGLDPQAGQCYFIAYGNQLVCQRSYFGDIAIARRFGLRSLEAQVIYQGDEVKINTLPDGGIEIKVSTQFENWDDKKIVGAYAVATMENGVKHTELMTWQQIRQSWMKSRMYNAGAQVEFPGEMAKRTVVRRALKWITNTFSPLGGVEDEVEEVTTEEGEIQVIPEPQTNQPVERVEKVKKEKKETIIPESQVNQQVEHKKIEVYESDPIDPVNEKTAELPF